MKLIYTNENQFLVNNAKNIIDNNNIEVTLKNEFSSGAAGVLAPLDTWVELWVIHDSDEEKAKGIVHNAKKKTTHPLIFVGNVKMKKTSSLR